MTILLVCLLIATVLPILSKGPVAWAMSRAGGYNNRYPREQQKGLTGFGARAKAAHENSFEALMMFAPGVLALVALGHADSYSQTLAVSFVVARLMYIGCYLWDVHWLRSVSWSVGFIASVLLMLQAVNHVA